MRGLAINTNRPRSSTWLHADRERRDPRCAGSKKIRLPRLIADVHIVIKQAAWSPVASAKFTKGHR